MTWIRFEDNEPPASLQRLTEIAQPGYDLAGLRENFSLVIFFTHDLACPKCRDAVAKFARRKTELDIYSAQVFVAAPAVPSDFPDLAPIQILSDPKEVARNELARLLEFDTQGKRLLFILNQYWVPSAAWVGDEADDPDLHERTFQRLDYLSVQCPE